MNFTRLNAASTVDTNPLSRIDVYIDSFGSGQMYLSFTWQSILTASTSQLPSLYKVSSAGITCPTATLAAQILL